MNKKVEIKAVIFDFGNVLIVDGQKILEEVFKLKELPKWRRDIYEAASHDTEKGLKPTVYWIEVIRKVFHLDYTNKEIEKLLFASKPIQPMIDLLNSLKTNPGLKIAILTNNQKSWPKKFIDLMNLNIKNVPIFNSALIGSRKPQRAPYLYALHKLKVRPEETIFIDDKLVNVQAANKIGIKGVHFDGDAQRVIKELKKFGVQVRI